MAQKPTHLIPDALTDEQRNGLACVTCGTAFGAGSRSVPVGEVDGAQVFACVGCVEYRCPHCGEQGALTDPDGAGDGDHYCGNCGTPINVRADVVFACTSHVADEKGVHSVRTLDDEQGLHAVETPADAAAGKSATWPDGEVASVRDMARRHDLARRADNLAALLERDLGNVRDERVTVAVRATIEGLRALSAACPTADEDTILRAAEHTHAALVRCFDLAVEIEQRTR